MRIFFQILFIPGTSIYITQLVMSWNGFLLFLLLLHPPQEYKPYRRKARWRKSLDQVWYKISKKINASTREAYLYLTARRRKYEANLRKGRQKGGRSYHYCRMRRIRALLSVLLLRTATATKSEQNL